MPASGEAVAAGRAPGSEPPHGKDTMTTTAIARRAKKQSNHKNRIRELRTARRLTLAHLGKLVGLTKVGVLQSERRDRAGWRLLERFADALHVSVDQVLGHDRTPPLPVDAFSRQDRELLDAMESRGVNTSSFLAYLRERLLADRFAGSISRVERLADAEARQRADAEANPDMLPPLPRGRRYPVPEDVLQVTFEDGSEYLVRVVQLRGPDPKDGDEAGGAI